MTDKIEFHDADAPKGGTDMAMEELVIAYERIERAGSTPEDAFFVRCDSTTTTQNDTGDDAWSETGRTDALTDGAESGGDVRLQPEFHGDRVDLLASRQVGRRVRVLRLTPPKAASALFRNTMGPAQPR